MSRENAEKKARELLSQVGLLSKEKIFPEFLSGGQQQRIAICRTLMMNPRVVLFDEPTSSLDPTMVGEVLAVMRMLVKKNLTMVIVTHEMNFAREIADRILFFADGGIYEQGTPEEIFENPKREKTFAFINRQKNFHYEIYDKNFDLTEMQGQIWTFAEKYGLSPKYAGRLQLCCEEIIFVMLENCFAEDEKISMTLDISYSEKNKISEPCLVCNGKNFNPFDTDKEDSEDNLGVTILKNLAKNFVHLYENDTNKIKFSLNIEKNSG